MLRDRVHGARPAPHPPAVSGPRSRGAHDGAPHGPVAGRVNSSAKSADTAAMMTATMRLLVMT